MHIPDGVLSPGVCIGTGVAAATAVGFSLRQMQRSPDSRLVPLTAMTASLIFAGQMVNFPVPISLLGIPAVSGHLLGGVLAAALVGPWAGCMAMFLVLFLQCFLFSDGGWLALGANTLNMAVLGCWGGYPVYAAIRRRLGHTYRSCVIGVVIAAWLSVLAAAALFCAELFLSLQTRDLNLQRIFTLMVTVHCVIGLGEAVITGGVIAFVLKQQPDLLGQTAPASSSNRIGQLVGVGLISALAVAAFLAPFASSAPDGLEAVAEATSVPQEETETRYALLSDYAVPAPVLSWKQTPFWQRATVSIAGLLGTCAVGVTAWLLGRGLRGTLITPATGGESSDHAE